MHLIREFIRDDPAGYAKKLRGELDDLMALFSKDVDNQVSPTLRAAVDAERERLDSEEQKPKGKPTLRVVK